MTIIIGICTSQAVQMFSDMRLSWNGEVRDDETVKACFFESGVARVIFGYTGLAEWKTNDPDTSFNTLAWLTGEISECLGRTTSINDLLRELRERASNTFNSHPALTQLAPERRRLSVVFLGYEYPQQNGPEEGRPFSAVLSNFEDVASEVRHDTAQSEFFLHVRPCDESGAQQLLLLGVQVVSDSRKAELTALIKEGKPPKALAGKALQIVAEASDNPRARGAVGPNTMEATLWPIRQKPPQSIYHSATGGDKIHLLGMVEPNGWAIARIQLVTQDKFPGRPNRNAPCPCGSGVKYKRCHGRTH
ncbi:YecA family protein [Methyloceanibacter sp. wino2]|uniref:YecA family protein n=1 Tax=Methyloceanibacter sp. wino2 TaxID=2170729 RepID=UPI000D3E67D1|nr:SEC-C domain-containing protein [Methyloceanibacter sp. wino2]